MSLIEYFPRVLISTLYSCSNCGKRISKDTLYCSGCNIQHLMPWIFTELGLMKNITGVPDAEDIFQKGKNVSFIQDSN